jgi:glycosyltransferase involved in cell wall biosynthesis
MKIVYSLPHPFDRLESGTAGHTVRANAILHELEQLGHEIVKVQAANANTASQGAVKGYRELVKRFLPKVIAMPLRDRGRVAFGKQYAERLRQIVEEVEPDIILETHIAFSLGGTLASRLTGVPLILDDVSPSWEEERQYGVGLNVLALDVHRQAMQQASRVVAVSAAIRQSLIDDGVAANKVITVHNGFNERLFHAGLSGQRIRQMYTIPEDALVLVFVGSFQPYHRVDLLLEAFKRLHYKAPLYLILVGGTAEKLGAYTIPENTILTGWLNPADVPEYIAAADIAVMPASNDFGNPMKIYEYMALGKAIVAPMQATLEEITPHDKGIYLFKPYDVAALTTALQQIIDDSSLRSRLGQEAQTLSHDHTWQNRAKQLQAAMLEVVKIGSV